MKEKQLLRMPACPWSKGGPPHSAGPGTRKRVGPSRVAYIIIIISDALFHPHTYRICPHENIAVHVLGTPTCWRVGCLCHMAGLTTHPPHPHGRDTRTPRNTCRRDPQGANGHPSARRAPAHTRPHLHAARHTPTMVATRVPRPTSHTTAPRCTAPSLPPPFSNLQPHRPWGRPSSSTRPHAWRTGGCGCGTALSKK